MKKICMIAICAIITALMVSGCGSSLSEDKPIVEVKQEAQTMDVGQLKTIVEKYQKAIEAKKPELQKLQAKLKEIPITEIMGKDAVSIKGEITALSSSIKALTDRMKVYQSALSQK